MPKLPKAERLPSGNWRIRIYEGMVAGKKKYETFTASSEDEVEMEAYQYLLKKQKRKNDAKLPLERRMTVGDAIDQHIEDNADVLSPRTVRRYKEDREKFFASIMDIKLCDLTQPDVQRAVSHDSRRYAAKSIHNAHGLLSAALSSFLPDFRLKTNLPQLVEPDLMVPEDDDIDRLMEAVVGTWMESAILLGACCGMRRSEICGLKYSDIDTNNLTITVRRTVIKDDNGKWITREKTKTTKSKRTFETAQEVIDALISNKTDEEFVVNVVPDTLSKSFIDLRDKLGIKCRFHDLRHHYASIMLAMGIPDKYAMERMGYSTPGTLRKVYQHTLGGRRKEIAAQVNQHIKHRVRKRTQKNDDNTD